MVFQVLSDLTLGFIPCSNAINNHSYLVRNLINSRKIRYANMFNWQNQIITWNFDLDEISIPIYVDEIYFSMKFLNCTYFIQKLIWNHGILRRGQYSLQSQKSLESEVITMIGHFLSNNHLLSPRSLLKIVLLQHPVGHLGHKTHKKSFKKIIQTNRQNLPQYLIIFLLSDNNFLF